MTVLKKTELQFEAENVSYFCTNHTSISKKHFLSVILTFSKHIRSVRAAPH